MIVKFDFFGIEMSMDLRFEIFDFFAKLKYILQLFHQPLYLEHL
ncbi:MAG: hypothetical protein HW405_707 [Candidatus Berkelbacteria bacterium]|nr:hypothetical protein [Candidatus Berkelbacteria bacterium]